jgi:PAS domain S-box-containing protein
MGFLASEAARNRRELKDVLANLNRQKFALDEHAIVSITDTEGCIVYANDRFCKVSGYRRDELLGQNHRIVNAGLHPHEFFRGHVDHHQQRQRLAR